MSSQIFLDDLFDQTYDPLRTRKYCWIKGCKCHYLNFRSLTLHMIKNHLDTPVFLCVCHTGSVVSRFINLAKLTKHAREVHKLPETLVPIYSVTTLGEGNHDDLREKYTTYLRNKANLWAERAALQNRNIPTDKSTIITKPPSSFSSFNPFTANVHPQFSRANPLIATYGSQPTSSATGQTNINKHLTEIEQLQTTNWSSIRCLKLYRCNDCSLTNVSIFKMQLHCNFEHNQQTSFTEVYECGQCTYWSTDKTYLSLHLTFTHGDSRKLECTTCGRDFCVNFHLDDM